ncbi:hypothetical protein F4561_003764 [Lipingzhangella halophila]|uniref:Uncharacterized protein n=1 Tax=Lipingzhangella halophila TaxID=1783352 RepID=A0A7W7RJ46_9ACTN|nr:hypothetical protein [Lipingzhangella halophila]MBB4932944.1 hypothetical protein [Lipingzhangella halophila]
MVAHRLLGEAALAADEHRFDDAEERMNAATPLLELAAQQPAPAQQPTVRG